jgi:drug/metabolite transporter (DMT)-like permease
MSPSGSAERLAERAAAAQRMRMLGIALMCGAVACFACLDATAKYLGRHVDVIEVVWARYASAFVLALIVSNPITRPGLLQSKRPALQIVRSSMLLGATVFNFLSFQFLQLDQALVIMFSIPLMVAALAGPMLGEWVGPRRWAAILFGFGGVVLVARPGYGSIHPAALLSVLAAACSAFYAIMTRTLARFDSNETTLFYSNLVGALALLPLMPMVWKTPADPLDIFLMITFGAFGSLGHYLLIVGHRHAPASVLSPFIYTQLVWTATLGYLVFGDVPSEWTLAGAAMVVASGLYLVHRERVRGPR